MSCWSRRVPFVLLALALLCIAAVPAYSYPKPSAVKVRWEFDFQSGPLRLYADRETRETFWYFTYEITNNEGRTLQWAPRMTLYTDAGGVLEAGRDVPSRVTDALVTLLNNEFLESQYQLIGDIRPGREHRREGLAVWPAGNLDLNEISLFVSGISGETTVVRSPIDGSSQTLYKTLQRDYLIRGEVLPRGSQPLDLIQQKWIFR